MSEDFHEDVLIAGYSGQGLMFIGKLLAYSAMKEGRNVTWIPSYGVEMRGGAANCTVVMSSSPIGSPVVAHPSTGIFMNQKSLEKFGAHVKDEGALFLNSSLINKKINRRKISTIEVPATEIAMRLGNKKVANMAMLGAYIAHMKTVNKESVIKALRHTLETDKKHLFKVNKEALEIGYEHIKSSIKHQRP
jgi:2-oxoglutarate ferredoxin oxidoreductase subunit gamma